MQHNKKIFAGNRLSKTTQRIFDYTHIGKIPFRLFFPCLTVHEQATAIWLVITGKLIISKGAVFPNPSGAITSSSDIFLKRLCQRITDGRHFEINDYNLITDLTEVLVRKDVRYVTTLYDLLHCIHGDRCAKIANAYLRLHSSSVDDKFRAEVNIAAVWEDYSHHGQAINAYKRAYESTDNAEKQAFCLQAIEQVNHRMSIIY